MIRLYEINGQPVTAEEFAIAALPVLATLHARIAAVEALADEWEREANRQGQWRGRGYARRLRAALDTAAAPTSATVRADAGRLALLEMADEIDRGPTFPLPPSVISALIRERAEAIRGVISALIRERAEAIRERAEAAGDDHA